MSLPYPTLRATTFPDEVVADALVELRRTVAWLERAPAAADATATAAWRDWEGPLRRRHDADRGADARATASLAARCRTRIRQLEDAVEAADRLRTTRRTQWERDLAVWRAARADA